MITFSPELIAGPSLFFGLGVLAWIYRSLIEDDVEPFILSLTLFAGIGTIVALVEHALARRSIGLALVTLTLCALLGPIFQILVYRHQIGITKSHLDSVLRSRIKSKSKANHKDIDIENWVYIGLQVMKVDFFPELYKTVYKYFGEDNNLGPRYERKNRFIHMLPKEKFNKENLTVQIIEVPPKQRETWWRLYFILFLLTWAFYVLANLVS